MLDPNVIVKSPIIKPEDLTLESIHKLGENSLPIWALSNEVHVDHRPLEFNLHRYLLPIYACTDPEMVYLKCAQVGFSIYLMLRLLWFLTVNQGTKAGLYLPNESVALAMSQDRLDPIIESCPAAYKIYDKASKLTLRKFGKSSLYIFSLGGVSSKDSVPLDFIAFDEVRLASAKDIDQTLYRIAHSSYKQVAFGSTCGRAGQTIHARFLEGKQYYWETRCGCKSGYCNLAETFPECIAENKTSGRVYYRCPKCGYEIKDPQNGRYIPRNESADFSSFHVSQLVSKFTTPREILRRFRTTTNMAEFYQATLGLPYTDEDNRGVSLEQIKACIKEDLPWHIHDTSPTKPRTSMGIDIGKGYAVASIMDVCPSSGKKRIRHLEVIDRSNPKYFTQDGKQQSPYVRCGELMEQFNVGICVMDHMPNPDEAITFAQRFPGKVFIAWYQENQKDVVVWGDRLHTKEGVRKSGYKFKFKYHTMINRFMGIDSILGEFRIGNVMLPNPDKLVLSARDEKTGILGPEAICWRFIEHLTAAVKQLEYPGDDETKEGRWRWSYSGNQDNHFLHSVNYAHIALERLKKQVYFSFA